MTVTKIYQISNSQETPHTSLSRGTYGVFVTRKLTAFLTSPHCIHLIDRRVYITRGEHITNNCFGFDLMYQFTWTDWSLGDIVDDKKMGSIVVNVNAEEPLDDKPTLVRVVAWWRQAIRHYLSQYCCKSLSHMVSLGHNALTTTFRIISQSYGEITGSWITIWHTFLPPGALDDSFTAWFYGIFLNCYLIAHTQRPVDAKQFLENMLFINCP